MAIVKAPKRGVPTSFVERKRELHGEQATALLDALEAHANGAKITPAMVPDTFGEHATDVA